MGFDVIGRYLQATAFQHRLSRRINRQQAAFATAPASGDLPGRGGEGVQPQQVGVAGIAHAQRLIPEQGAEIEPFKTAVTLGFVREWPFVVYAVLVLALAHGDAQLEMDWWDNRQGRTPGNRQLIKINQKMAKWFRKAYAVEAKELPYHAHQRGVFLKDAAVLAGLGVVGKNNLLVTPEYGPRVRLRALLLDRYVECTGPLAGFFGRSACEIS